jgi:uncharacterized protein (DUF2236 family)
MAPADDGYFPRGKSMLRRVHEERAVGLFYGQRALAIGALYPPTFIGTALHTRSPDKPFQRLGKTGKMFETIFFGSRKEADAVLAVVHNMHRHVKGTFPQPAGRYPAGTPYSAFDPGLMLWTIAVAADSAMTFYELFVRRLDDQRKDEFWADYVRFGELFGMPADVAPTSWAEFCEYFDEMVESDRMHLTDEAHYTASAIMFEIPVPAVDFAAMRVHNLIMLGALPPRVRRLYGLRYTPAHAAAFRAVVAGLRASRPLTPGALRRGRNSAFFDRVMDTERSRIARGIPTPGLPAQAGH